MKTLKKTGLVLLIVLSILGLAIILFIKLWPDLGGKVSKEDEEDYMRRADNYANGKFSNMFASSGPYKDPFADRTTGKGAKPADTLPTVTPTFLDNPGYEDFTITWYGHSTLLLQLAGKNILIDPVFSEVASPVSFVGSFRYSPLVSEISDLPHIDICILSHDHYDHLDTSTIKQLSDKTNLFIAPLGVENHLVRWGIDESRIHNMAWWEEIKLEGLTIGCLPANHFSGRYLLDSDETLWASWVFITDTLKILESGDSGYSDHFKKIFEKYGSFDFVMTDHAQYNERWHSSHMFPEEAVQAVLDMQSTLVMPVHWGAFSLAPHAWDESVERFVRYGEEKDLTVITPKLGETMEWENITDYQDRWWRDYK